MHMTIGFILIMIGVILIIIAVFIPDGTIEISYRETKYNNKHKTK